MYIKCIIIILILVIRQMGATPTSQIQKSFYDKLVFVKSLDISKSLMKDPKTQQLYAIVQHTFPSEEQMHKFSQQLNRRKQICHQYYMSPLKKFVVSSSNLCSRQHKIVQIFKWEQYSLMDEIKSRKDEKKQFSDRQIWSILCSCVLAMSYFTKNQITHFTLHPKDIILTNQGQVKILAAELSEYQFDYTYKHGFYYAPQTLKAINSRTVCNVNNKSTVFTLGMTLLSTMNVQDLSYIYKDGSSIDYNQIKILLENVENEHMKNVLSKMLKQAAYQRISFTQLEQMLYEILQSNQALSEAQIQPQQHQIQRLQQSIYRLRTKNEQEKSEHLLLSQENSGQDFEDVPNILGLMPSLDLQVMDQEQNQKSRKSTNNQKLSQDRQTTDNSRTNKYSFMSNQLNMRGPLIDKSNSIQISQSLKIVDDSVGKKIDFFSLSKTSRQQGPTYVTQQYSRGKYQGYKQNGMRHGFGTFYYEQGGKYSGEWCKNKMQGRGALYYTNGELAYEGEWNQDQLHGYGVLYNECPAYITQGIDWKSLDKINLCWVKYEGNFGKDMRHGQGTLFLGNGEYFRGEFKNDLPNGKGLYRTLNNQLIKGCWKNGAFEGFQQ